MQFNNFDQKKESPTSFLNSSNGVLSSHNLVDVIEKVLKGDLDLEIFDKLNDISFVFSYVVVVFVKIFSKFSYFVPMELVSARRKELVDEGIAEKVVIKS